MDIDQAETGKGFPLETLVAIIVFWVVIFIILVLLIRRVNRMKALPVCQQACSEEPRRIIQIYYIGNENVDDAELNNPTGNIFRKIISTVDDHPPSYDEVATPAALNSRTLDLAVGPLSPSSSSSINQENLITSVSSTSLSNAISNSGIQPDNGQVEEQQDVVVVVERTMP